MYRKPPYASVNTWAVEIHVTPPISHGLGFRLARLGAGARGWTSVSPVSFPISHLRDEQLIGPDIYLRGENDIPGLRISWQLHTTASRIRFLLLRLWILPRLTSQRVQYQSLKSYACLRESL
jgi:hypothetical protein